MNKSNQIKCKSAFFEMGNLYCKLLSNFYPADRDKGFEERNLTNNFVFSLLKSLEDENAVAWFEMSFGKRRKIDAVVYSPLEKSVFFIEAKRLTNKKLDFKIESINKDLEWLLANKYARLETVKKYNPSEHFIHHYAVCLADVWAERKDTELIPNKWKNEEVLIPKWKVQTVMNECFSFKHHSSLREQKSLNNYHLLATIFEILE